MKSSQLSGFYKQSIEERTRQVQAWADLSEAETDDLVQGLSLAQADVMIENVIGTFNLPLAVATNFKINDQDVLIPMVVEEPSIVAAVSYAAKLALSSGGFKTSSSEPVMIGQIQVLDLPDVNRATKSVLAEEASLLKLANQHHPSIQARGGGAKAIECRPLPETSVGPMLIVHLLYDCRDAMGANAVNTAVEALAPSIEAITGGRVNLRILSNLSDQRTATAECSIKADALSRNELAGSDVVKSIIEAWAFAEADPYRAATHNKGIMNGIDPVAVATGNDWRALEAGAHAFAAQSGRYTSMTTWSQNEAGDLCGHIHLPMSVGTVGGATKVHPTAKVAMKILGYPDARRLSEIMAAVGLAQNLAAIRALATEGIQQGHMRLHARQVALAAGADEADVQHIANLLVQEGNVREARAKEIIAEAAR
ncbi:MAG: hydroxymethylglutaryl-CoA reductase, degradative [Chloroflexota bacterium]